METIIDHSTLEEWRAGLRGAAYVPGEEGYDEARAGLESQRSPEPGPGGRGRGRGRRAGRGAFRPRRRARRRGAWRPGTASAARATEGS